MACLSPPLPIRVRRHTVSAVSFTFYRDLSPPLARHQNSTLRLRDDSLTNFHVPTKKTSLDQASYSTNNRSAIHNDQDKEDWVCSSLVYLYGRQTDRERDSK